MPIRYFVSDLDTSLKFYVDILGFTLDEQWGPAFAMVSKGSDSLWLSGPGTSAMKAVVNGESPKPGGWNRVVVAVDDLDNAIETLNAAGANILIEPISGPGGRQILVADPDGNHIEVFEARNS